MDEDDDEEDGGGRNDYMFVPCLRHPLIVGRQWRTGYMYNVYIYIYVYVYIDSVRTGADSDDGDDGDDGDWVFITGGCSGTGVQ